MPRIADHDGIAASFKLKSEIPKAKSKIIYDYKNTDVPGLINHIKHVNFESLVFNQSVETQTEHFNQILIDAFNQFVPCKKIKIRPADQPWSNTYIHGYCYVEKTETINFIKRLIQIILHF